MSDYNDFWFIDIRNQNNNIKRWFFYGIFIFLFVGICTFVCVRSMYQPIETSNIQIQAENLVVKVEEAKKTNVNGYIKGTVTNETETEIKGKYIKFDFYTENDVDIGKEYVEIGSVGPQETKTYEAKFRYPNVERVIITITDSKE